MNASELRELFSSTGWKQRTFAKACGMTGGDRYLRKLMAGDNGITQSNNMLIRIRVDQILSGAIKEKDYE